MTFRLAVSEDEHRFHVQWRIASGPIRHAWCSKFTALLRNDRFRLLVLKVLHFDPLPLRLATLPSSSECTPSVAILEIDRNNLPDNSVHDGLGSTHIGLDIFVANKRWM